MKGLFFSMVKKKKKNTSKQVIKEYPVEWSKEEVQLLKKLRPNHTMQEIQEQFLIHGFMRSYKALERKASNSKIFRYVNKTNSDTTKKLAQQKENLSNDLEIDDKYESTWKKILNQ